MLTSISIYIGILILGIGEILFAKIVLNDKIKVSKVKIILTLLITTLFCYFANTYLTGVIKTLLVCIIHMIEFKYLFKIEYLKSTFLAIMHLVTLLIPEMLVVFSFTMVFGINKTFFYEEIAGMLIGNIIICILFVLLTLLLKRILRKLINYKMENNTKIIVFTILTFLCIAVIFYNAFLNIELNISLIISVLIMFVFIWILISLMKQTIQNNNLTKQYEQILEFMTTYEDEVEKQRVLRHETKNAFLTIKSQITDKNKEKEIIEYINSILEEDTKMKYEEYAKFKNLPANGIKGLCYYKMQEAENKGIKISINISERLTKSVLFKLSVHERKELGKLLGVFLDNAIEASTNSEEKVMGLEAYVVKDDVKIIISNSYQGKIDTTKIGQERYSTKGKNRGHGLLLVKSIVNNNKIFETNNEIADKLYIQNIIIKRSTDKE